MAILNVVLYNQSCRGRQWEACILGYWAACHIDRKQIYCYHKAIIHLPGIVLRSYPDTQGLYCNLSFVLDFGPKCNTTSCVPMILLRAWSCSYRANSSIVHLIYCKRYAVRVLWIGVNCFSMACLALYEIKKSQMLVISRVRVFMCVS